MPEKASSDRPVIFSYRAIPSYLDDMLAWRQRQDRKFSVRAFARENRGCSPALIALLRRGKRRLTRDQVPAISRLLGLNRQEALYLDRWVTTARSQTRPQGKSRGWSRTMTGSHLLSDWLNLYVKDAAALEGFKPDADTLFKLLGGIASRPRIARSLAYLTEHGYLRRTLDGRIVRNDPLVITTDDVPSVKIRAFHRQALALASRALLRFPVNQRRANAVLVSVNHKRLEELNELIREFYESLLEFAEVDSGGEQGLYQVLLNLSPVCPLPARATHEKR